MFCGGTDAAKRTRLHPPRPRPLRPSPDVPRLPGKSTRKHSQSVRLIRGTPEELHSYQSNTNGAARVSQRPAASKAPLSTLTRGEPDAEFGADSTHPLQAAVLPPPAKTPRAQDLLPRPCLSPWIAFRPRSPAVPGCRQFRTRIRGDPPPPGT